MSAVERPKQLALSLKQPWAALLVAGLKTIEVRRWNTHHRGELFIHAARIADPREEGWQRVPAHLLPLARMEGGVIGIGTLTECVRYGDVAAFTADQAHHLNEPDWFQPDGLYGFRFADLCELPFQRVPGYVRIFALDVEIARPAFQVPPPPEPEEVVPGRLGRLMATFGKKKSS